MRSAFAAMAFCIPWISSCAEPCPSKNVTCTPAAAIASLNGLKTRGVNELLPRLLIHQTFLPLALVASNAGPPENCEGPDSFWYRALTFASMSALMPDEVLDVPLFPPHAVTTRA